MDEFLDNPSDSESGKYYFDPHPPNYYGPPPLNYYGPPPPNYNGPPPPEYVSPFFYDSQLSEFVDEPCDVSVDGILFRAPPCANISGSGLSDSTPNMSMLGSDPSATILTDSGEALTNTVVPESELSDDFRGDEHQVVVNLMMSIYYPDYDFFGNWLNPFHAYFGDCVNYMISIMMVCFIL